MHSQNVVLIFENRFAIHRGRDPTVAFLLTNIDAFPKCRAHFFKTVLQIHCASSASVWFLNVCFFFVVPCYAERRKNDLRPIHNCQLLSSLIDWRTHKAGKAQQYYMEQTDEWRFDVCV